MSLTEMRAAIKALDEAIDSLDRCRPISTHTLAIILRVTGQTDELELLERRPRLAFHAPWEKRQRLSAMIVLARLRADLLDELVVLERVS